MIHYLSYSNLRLNLLLEYYTYDKIRCNLLHKTGAFSRRIKLIQVKTIVYFLVSQNLYETVKNCQYDFQILSSSEIAMQYIMQQFCKMNHSSWVRQPQKLKWVILFLYLGTQIVHVVLSTTRAYNVKFSHKIFSIQIQQKKIT